MNRRNFIASSATALVASGLKANSLPSDREDAEKGLRLRFLGTGAADWNGKDERGELRRLSSVLLDNRILIDFTNTVMDMLPEGRKPETIFYTHSHGDHFNAEAALTLGIRTAYVSETWWNQAEKSFQAASKALGKEMPLLIPICTGQPIPLGDITFTPLPANHATSYLREQALIYLVEKGNVRMLYATDTGGLPAVAARMAGIDAHVPGKGITALVMEATMGIDYEEDYRLYTHSSVALVKRMVDVLISTKRYIPQENQPVYLTHMARTLHGTQAELDTNLPAPLKAAYDGLEVMLK